MFANRLHRLDFADTRSLPAEQPLSLAGVAGLDNVDPLEQLESAGAADTHLLQLVICTACATLTLALVSSLA